MAWANPFTIYLSTDLAPGTYRHISAMPGDEKRKRKQGSQVPESRFKTLMFMLVHVFMGMLVRVLLLVFMGMLVRVWMFMHVFMLATGVTCLVHMLMFRRHIFFLFRMLVLSMRLVFMHLSHLDFIKSQMQVTGSGLVLFSPGDQHPEEEDDANAEDDPDEGGDHVADLGVEPRHAVIRQGRVPEGHDAPGHVADLLDELFPAPLAESLA
jgi:hypothetical protein